MPLKIMNGFFVIILRHFSFPNTKVNNSSKTAAFRFTSLAVGFHSLAYQRMKTRTKYYLTRLAVGKKMMKNGAWRIFCRTKSNYQTPTSWKKNLLRRTAKSDRLLGNPLSVKAICFQ